MAGVPKHKKPRNASRTWPLAISDELARSRNTSGPHKAYTLWCGFVTVAFATYDTSSSIGQDRLHILKGLIFISIVARVGCRGLFMVSFSHGVYHLPSQLCSACLGTTAIGFASSKLYPRLAADDHLTVWLVGYILFSEASSMHLGLKTVALTVIACNLFVPVELYVGPYLRDATKGNWKGKPGFLLAGGGRSMFLRSWIYLLIGDRAVEGEGHSTWGHEG
ncbi:hypothetical protein BDV11DRAFT_174953 [Aspergillus similis]